MLLMQMIAQQINRFTRIAYLFVGDGNATIHIAQLYVTQYANLLNAILHAPNRKTQFAT